MPREHIDRVSEVPVAGIRLVAVFASVDGMAMATKEDTGGCSATAEGSGAVKG